MIRRRKEGEGCGFSFRSIRDIRQRIDGAKTVSDGTIIVDRDMNSACGIMLRALYGKLGRFQAAGANVALVAE